MRSSTAGPVNAATACTTAIVAVTALAAIAAAADPALVSSTPPHPTLHPTLSTAASILVNNTRVLALPYGLVILGAERVGPGRVLGSAAVVGVLSANAVTVGLATGRWQGRLVAYLPHLPLEWAAAGVAASVWARVLASAPRDTGDLARTGDRQTPRGRELWATAAVTLMLLTAAAAVEVLLTPHAARVQTCRPSPTSCRRPDSTSNRGSAGQLVGHPNGLPRMELPAGSFSARPTPGRYKVASLPSPRHSSVPLRRDLAVVALVHSTPDPLKEGP